MTADLERDKVFWKLVGALDSSGTLPHVMIIGTWAEWLYTDYFEALGVGSDYRVDIGKTHDIDVYFCNYLMEIEGGERLEALSMLVPTWVEKRGYRICIPTPASYVAQKLFINPTRRPEDKRDQDIRKVDVLLRAMAAVPGQMDDLSAHLKGLTPEKLAQVRAAAEANGIELPPC